MWKLPLFVFSEITVLVLWDREKNFTFSTPCIILITLPPLVACFPCQKVLNIVAFPCKEVAPALWLFWLAPTTSFWQCCNQNCTWYSKCGCSIYRGITAKPVHIYLKVNPIMANGAYSQVTVDRIVPLATLLWIPFLAWNLPSSNCHKLGRCIQFSIHYDPKTSFLACHWNSDPIGVYVKLGFFFLAPVCIHLLTLNCICHLIVHTLRLERFFWSPFVFPSWRVLQGQLEDNFHCSSPHRGPIRTFACLSSLWRKRGDP